ncbi:MAG TPA: multicopper oxidase family protein [Xanthobacteraceae bacterium]|nr:multicopper oxidase family protein [Xanthobacteraceae bacterium]
MRVTGSGYDGMMPGPELRVKRGETFSIRVVNELEEPTAVHWHGVRLVNAMDGAPPLTQPPIAPGASFDYRFVAPDAGTFWYHPPLWKNTNLYGALIVEEPAPVDADTETTLVFAAAKNGDLFTVNGDDMQVGEVIATQRVRLRLINACATKILRLHVANLRTLVMAVDGQPAQPFTAREGDLTLGPGNRMDVFVDCRGEGGSWLITMQNTDGINAPVAKIVAAHAANGTTRRGDPKPLPSNPLPERMDFRDAVRIEAAVGRERAVKSETPLFTVRRGRTVMLGLSNPTAANAYMHLHGHSFRLLDALDDGWKPFWLDTMPIAPGGLARIAFVADNPGKWLIEGLYRPQVWFEVT